MSKHERTVTEGRQGGGDELSGQMESSCDGGFYKRFAIRL